MLLGTRVITYIAISNKVDKIHQSESFMWQFASRFTPTYTGIQSRGLKNDNSIRIAFRGAGNFSYDHDNLGLKKESL